MGCAASIRDFYVEDVPVPGETAFVSFSYELGKAIGSGRSSLVRSAERLSGSLDWHQRCGFPRVAAPPCEQGYAAKVVRVQSRDSLGMIDARLLQVARKEALLWQQVGRHEHTVELFNTFYEITGQYVMVMERCVCSLADVLRTCPPMSEAAASSVFRQILLGVRHVHWCNIVHRNIRPDNILFGGPQGRTVKITDFGEAAVLPKKGLLKGLCGSFPYVSPEMQAGRGYDGRTDIWSVGAIAYNILYDDWLDLNVAAPEPPAAPLLGWLQQNELSPGPPVRQMSVQSARLEHFVQTLMNSDPETRCRADEALCLPLVHAVAVNFSPRTIDEMVSRLDTWLLLQGGAADAARRASPALPAKPLPKPARLKQQLYEMPENMEPVIPGYLEEED